MKVLLKRKMSIVVLIIQFLVSAVFCGVAFYVDFIPSKYIAAVIALVVVLMIYQILSQLTNSSYIIGRILCVFFCAIFLGGGYYLYDAHAAIDDLSGLETKLDEISYYVLQDDPAKSLQDAKDYTFGILEMQDRENTDKTLQEGQKETGKALNVQEFEDIATLVDALYAKEVQAIVFNKAFLNTISDQYSTFSTDTRELAKHQIETIVQQQKVETDVTTKPFNVYISGIDLYGDISATSRSDVNVIATINPITKKILLTTTPRDYYVELFKDGKSYSNGMPDKLTHAGLYGVDCSMGTLEHLYDIDIDYYVRVNFSSLRKIVNLLGGVEVYSDYDFESDWGPHGAGTHYHFKKGYNKVNGKKALAFCRERHHFVNGDYQRGRNHQHMIEAILNKVLSPSVLPNFSSLLKESKNMFRTNMSTKKITSLCNMQLSDMAQWKISYANADGTGASKPTYSIRSPKYVCIPSMDSINKITKKMKKVMKGTKKDEEDEEDSAATSAPQPTLEP